MPKTYVIELRKGEIYFWAAFYDGDLKFPKIETLVYAGRDERGFHSFQDAASYADQQQGREVDEVVVLAVADGDLDQIVDKAHLIEWLKDDHSPTMVGPTYEYKEVG